MLENPPLDNHSYPLSYVKHVNFLNFEEFGRKNPIYINMVRHPVERIISWYYYIRQNWYQLKGDKNDPDKFELKNDLSPTFFKVILSDQLNLYKPGGILFPPHYYYQYFSDLHTVLQTINFNEFLIPIRNEKDCF